MAERDVVLSILICHLSRRVEEYAKLRAVLDPQLPANGSVEVVVNEDGGALKIGAKRNQLIASAKGEYVAFVDDDDMVSPDYVSKVLAAVRTRPDCVGIEGIVQIDTGDKKFVHSLECAGWYETDQAFYRTPNHLNPIKRSIAARAAFPPSMSYGEDTAFSKSVHRLLKSEVFVDGPIYFYNMKGRKVIRVQR